MLALLMVARPEPDLDAELGHLETRSVVRRSLLTNLIKAGKKLYNVKYGRWCGAKHTELGQGSCNCRFNNFQSMVQKCKKKGAIDAMDYACVEHDVCATCLVPKVALGTWSIYHSSRRVAGFVHWCDCERNLYNSLAKAKCGSTSRSSCPWFRKMAMAFFKSYPCACPANFRCYKRGSWWRKEWHTCDSKLVWNFTKCRKRKNL